MEAKDKTEAKEEVNGNLQINPTTLDIICDPNPPLSKFSKADQEKMSYLIVSDLAKSEYQDIKPEHFSWVLNFYEYALTIKDFQSRNENSSISGTAFNFYFYQIKKLIESKKLQENEQYLITLLIQLSKIFSNDSYITAQSIPNVSNAQNTENTLSTSDILELYKLAKDKKLSNAARTIFSLVIGSMDLVKFDVSTSKDKSVLIQLSSSDGFTLNFLNRFNPLIDFYISKSSTFRAHWIQKFTSIFLSVKDNHIQKQINPEIFDSITTLIDYFRGKIDNFPNEEKNKAFTQIIRSWKYLAENKRGIFFDLPTEEIKTDFLKWFSPDLECHYSFHPLFELIKIGEQKDNQKINNIAKDIIMKILDKKYGKDSGLYLNLPSFAFDFLISNIDFITGDNFPKFTNYFNHLKELLGNEEFSEDSRTCVLYLLTSIREVVKKENFEPLTDTFMVFLEELFKNKQKKKVATVLSTIFVYLLSYYHIDDNKNSKIWCLISNFFEDKSLNQEHKHLYCLLNLIFGFIPHIMSKGKFIPMPKLIEQCSLENNGFNSYEIQEQKLLLISLMLLSEGSEHFHDNISLFKSIYRFVCMPPKSDEKLNNFFRMAKISLITSCGRFIEHKDIKFNFKSENYVTLQYIISVIGHNQIAIRHGLGYNIFEVENLTKNEFKIEDDQQFGTYERIEPYNIYKSQCDFDDPNDEKNLQEVDSLFNCEEDFYELEETTTESTLNSAHSFLCDLGFLSKDSISHTRKIYESNFMVKKIESIDRKVSTPLKVPILQIVHKNEDFVAKETKLAKELLKNIENVGNSRIFHFKYLTYKNSEKNQIEKESKRLGYVIILNEMNMEINSKASINDQYKVILCLTPINGFYVVNFIYKENSVFKEKGQMKFIVYKEYIGQIITLVSLLIHSAEPDEFIMCFERRTKIIKEVFDAAKMEEPDFRTFFFGAYEDAFGDK